MSLKRTGRGFATTRTPVRSCHQKDVSVRLTESSAIESHPHIWVFLDGQCYEHLGEHSSPAAHLSLASAKRLHKQLGAMIEELSGAGVDVKST